VCGEPCRALVHGRIPANRPSRSRGRGPGRVKESGAGAVGSGFDCPRRSILRARRLNHWKVILELVQDNEGAVGPLWLRIPNPRRTESWRRQAGKHRRLKTQPRDRREIVRKYSKSNKTIEFASAELPGRLKSGIRRPLSNLQGGALPKAGALAESAKLAMYLRIALRRSPSDALMKRCTVVAAPSSSPGTGSACGAVSGGSVLVTTAAVGRMMPWGDVEAKAAPRASAFSVACVSCAMCIGRSQVRSQTNENR
jgi:hypothetical protein